MIEWPQFYSKNRSTLKPENFFHTHWEENFPPPFSSHNCFEAELLLEQRFTA
jgi:hypothetical protein